MESDPPLAAAVTACFSNWLTQDDASCFDVSMVRNLLMAGGFSAVLVAGGSPCQDVSSLNRARKGMGSECANAALSVYTESCGAMPECD